MGGLRRGRVGGAGAVFVWTLSASAPARAAQPTGPPLLPEPAEEVASAVESALRDYYDRWQRLPPTAPGLCDADLGQDCHGRDRHGGCNRVRCRSPEEMAAFVERLASLTKEYPNDPVPLSHAVYAAVRLGRAEAGRDLIRRCRAGASEAMWWCDLSAGYLQHRTGRSTVSERLFRRALRAMPRSIRCGLENVQALLPDDAPAKDRYAATPCDARVESHRWFWWASDPFLVVEGNDRWVEHLTRGFEGMVSADLTKRITDSNVFGRGGGHVRRGFPDSYDRRYRPEQSRQRLIAWTSRRAAFNHFVPEALSLDEVHEGLSYRLAPDIEPGYRSEEGYSPLTGLVSPLPIQVARFRDGDSLVVALASDLSSSGPIAPTGRAHFVASERPGHVLTLDPAPVAERVAFAGRVANRKQVVGIEVLTPGDDARSRRVLRPLPPVRQAVSDLLLFRPTGLELPATRRSAVGLMYGSMRIPSDRELGLYWETYGLSSGETVAVSIRMEAKGGGWLFGFFGALGLGDGGHEGSVAWEETVDERNIFRRSFILEMQDVDKGRYELTLELETSDGMRLTRVRSFEVVGS